MTVSDGMLVTASVLIKPLIIKNVLFYWDNIEGFVLDASHAGTVGNSMYFVLYSLIEN